MFDDLISGMEDDLYNNRYRTFDELYVYCYRVASVVGLMCIEVYGYDNPMAKKYAESWGIFMQTTNVLRDVGEDISETASTSPLNELERNGMEEQELDQCGVLNKHWEPTAVMRRALRTTLRRPEPSCRSFHGEHATHLRP